MSYRFDVSPARQIDLENEFEVSRKRAESDDRQNRRLEMLERRTRLLEQQVQILTQLLRTAGVDGLYSVQLESN